MRWILIIIIISLNSSCWSVNHKNFRLPLNTYVKNNGLKMNGYFINYDSLNSFSLFLFYNNGVVYSVRMGGFKKKGEIDSFINSNVLVDQNVLSDAKKSGAFRINENKIEINIIQPTHYQRHKVNELQGTLLTDTSFVIFSDYMPGFPEENDTLIYHFVPSSIKPDSTNWVMKRKWYSGK